MSRRARSQELGLKLWTSSAVHRSSSDPFAPSHRRRKKWYNFEPIMSTDSFSSLTKKEVQVSNHFDVS